MFNKNIHIVGFKLNERSTKYSSVDEKESEISCDITSLLQQLITDELDNLISTIILATNGSTCKEVETSLKHPKDLYLVDKEDKRKCSFVRSRHLIRHEQSLPNITRCMKNGETEQKHKNCGIIQGDDLRYIKYLMDIDIL
jgi:hypothetical protein